MTQSNFIFCLIILVLLTVIVSLLHEKESVIEEKQRYRSLYNNEKTLHQQTIKILLDTTRKFLKSTEENNNQNQFF